MGVRLEDDRLLLDTIDALCHKCEYDKARALLVRVDKETQRRLWDVKMLLAERELSGERFTEEELTDMLALLPRGALPVQEEVEVLLLKGRIHRWYGDVDRADDYFFQALLDSRDSDFDAGKVWALMDLAIIARIRNQFEKALDLIDTAESLLDQLPDFRKRTVELDVWLTKSRILLSMQDYTRMEKSVDRLLERVHPEAQVFYFAQALNYKAIIHAARGSQKEALPMFLQALQISKSIAYQVLSRKIETNIATIYAQIQNYPEALRRYKAILKEYDRSIRPERRATLLNNIGNLYLKLRKWNKAIAYFADVEAIARQTGHQLLERLAFCQIARCLVESNSLDALPTHLKSFDEDLLNTPPFNGQQILYYVKAKFAFANKAYKDTITFAKKAIRLALKFKDDTTELNALSILARAYEKNQDTKAAVNVYKKITVKREKLEKRSITNRITKTEIDYIIAAKEKEIQALTRENQLQAELLKSASLVRTKQRALIKKNEEISLFAQNVALELGRYIRRLHHDIFLLRDSGAAIPESLQHTISSLESHINHMARYASVIRQSAGGQFRPADLWELINLDMAEEIRAVAARLDFVSEVEEMPFGYRLLKIILTELVRNALRFSPGEPVISVHFASHEDGYVIRVQDRGIGIDEADEDKLFLPFYRTGRLPAKEGVGLGLTVCHDLVEKMGGVIKAFPMSPDGGLRINISLPSEAPLLLNAT